jgi:hypothetical protein
VAIVRQLRHAELEGHSKHSDTECTYAIVNDTDGRYLQVDTYGSRHRRIPGKKSQSIRFSPDAIEQLKAILGRHF